MRGRQQQLCFSRRGGKRKGAGRRSKDGRRRVAHRKRAKVSRNQPLHVTLRLRHGLPNLRRRDIFKLAYRAFCASCDKGGFRICEYSVQGNHVHMICEADDAGALARGMQGFSIRFARAINKRCGRQGAVFDGRYDARSIKTPRQMRATLVYVLNNDRRHNEDFGVGGVRQHADVCSSAYYFDGWASPPGVDPPGPDRPVAPAQSWLLQVGWRRYAPIGVTEVPAAGRLERGPLELR
jgi:putative transposase